MTVTDDITRVRFATAGTNWLTITSQLMIDIKSGGTPDLESPNQWRESSRIEVVSPPVNRAALSTVDMVGRGEADVAVTSCPDTIYMARNGLGPFSEAHEIETIARLPHDDQMAFAVRADSDIESIRQIREERRDIDIARRLPARPPHRDISGFVQDQILREYGITDERIRNWGGTVDYGARKRVDRIKEGEFDVIFDEAIMTPQWNEIAHSVDLRFLPVEEEVIDFLSDYYHMERGVLPEGRLPGIDRDIPTVSKSGWILLTRADVPDHATYRILQALDNRKEQLREYFVKVAEQKGATGSSLSSDIDLSETWKDTGGPIHSGAKQYYEEMGYMD